MADRVQYVMDRMSATFKQLIELKVFRQEEIKSIVKKRTDYEYILRRRELKVSDYYSYLQYELNLEKLRVLRSGDTGGPYVDKERINAMRILNSACLKHICYVFERAVRRFPGEISLWDDFISFLKEKNLISLLNTTFGKALSLNPNNEDLWLQAAAHELETNSNLHAARVLLQRSLRSNKDSKKLWTRYFELELWSAVRIVERQRLLGLNIDDAPIEGAPLVVFKHAIRALPGDVAFACQLHASSAKVSRSLANSLEKQLRKAHHESTELWQYLTESAFESVLGSDDATMNRKRKLAKLEATDTLAMVTRALTESGKVLAEARSAMVKDDVEGEEEEEDDDDEGDGEKMNEEVQIGARKKVLLPSQLARQRSDRISQLLKYPLVAAASIKSIVQKAASVLGSISMVAIASEDMVTDESLTTDTSNNGGNGMNKRRKGVTSEGEIVVVAQTITADSAEGTTTVNTATTTETKKQLSALVLKLNTVLLQLCGVLREIETMASAATSTSAATATATTVTTTATSASTVATSKKDGSTLKKSAKQLTVKSDCMVARSHIFMIQQALFQSNTVNVPAGTVDHLVSSKDVLFDWVAATAELLCRTAVRDGAPTGDGKGELEVSVTAWSKVVDALLSSQYRQWLSACSSSSVDVEAGVGEKSGLRAVSEGTDDCEASTVFRDELFKTVRVAVAAAEVVVCSEEGTALMLRCLELLTVLDCTAAEMEAVFRVIIGSARCMRGTRGQWCARYIRYLTVHTHENTHTIRVSSVEEAFSFIEQTLTSRTDLSVGSSMEPFYETVLDIELLKSRMATSTSTTASTNTNITNSSASASSSSSQSSLLSLQASMGFARRVAESAVKVCPYVREFWARYEEIERLRGDYKSANHLRWKKDSLTKLV